WWPEPGLAAAAGIVTPAGRWGRTEPRRGG
ncbi:MAG: hypothetical protein AVDCRST_MAG64-2536, partial [uncultured Phycisphaerae bacterium]